MKNKRTNAFGGAFTGIAALALVAAGTAFAQDPYSNGAPAYDPNAGAYNQGAYPQQPYPNQGAYPPQGVYGDPNAPQEYSQYPTQSPYPAGAAPAQVYSAGAAPICGPGTVWVDGYYDAYGNPVNGYCAVLPYTDAYWISPYWFGGRFYAGYWGHGGYLGHGPGWGGYGFRSGFRGGYAGPRGGFNNGFRGPVNGFRGTAPGFRNSAPSFRAPSSNGFRGGNPAANSGIFSSGGARSFAGSAPRSGGGFSGGASHGGGFSGGGHAGGGSHGGGHR